MDKKIFERNILEKFKSVYPDFPSDPIVASEEPDFLVGELGIEIVRYVRGPNAEKGSTLRKGEENAKRILNKAKHNFEAKFSIPLTVYLIWHPNLRPEMPEVQQLASELAELVEQHLPHDFNGSVEVDAPELHTKYSSAFSKYINHVHILRMGPGQMALWTSVESGWIEVLPNEFQQIVAAKEAKLPEYRKKCKSIWLLIVAEGTHVSSIVDFQQGVRYDQINSSFDKVLFFDLMKKTVINLSAQG